VPIFFKAVKASALVDTGSSDNFISRDLADFLVNLKLGNRYPELSYARLANGLVSESKETLLIQTKFATLSWRLKFHVLNKLSYPVIVGFSSLRLMGASVNCIEGTLEFNFTSEVKIPFLQFPNSLLNMHMGAVQSVERSEIDFQKICQEFSDVLTDRLGQAKNYKYQVHLSDSIPVRRAPYPLSPPQAQVMREHINSLLAKGVISPSKSAYAAPAFLVRKPNGEFRLCIDYRQLNKKVIMDSFPVPAIEHVFQCLRGARVFTSLDLNSAFYQIELSEESKNVTSFITPEGQWCFHKAPFGLSVSPSALNRLMFDIFADLRYKSVIVFFDDLLIYSPDYDSHVIHVNEALRRLRDAGLTVNPEKVKFARTELKFLGHSVSASGLSVDVEKVKAIEQLPVPKNLKQLQSFIGLINYYSKFIPEYARIVAPLNDLRKKGAKFHFGEEQLSSFGKLKQCLSAPPVLRFPDFQRKFLLQTDASSTHLGCVLLQEFEDGLHPIQYASRRLSAAESRYCTFEQEALSCIWAMEKFKSYLSHQPFILQTDSACLRWLMEHPRNLGRVGRWLLRISRFDFEVRHIRGKDNVTADCLTRLVADIKTSPEDPVVLNALGSPAEDSSFSHDLKRLQQNDREVRFIRSQLRQNNVNKDTRNFVIQDNSVFRCVGRRRLLRLFVPGIARPSVIKEFHHSTIGGHPGISKTFRAIARRFWWPKMFLDIRDSVKRCDLCVRHKPDVHPDKVVQSSTIPVSVWDKIYIDLMGPLIPSASGNKFVFLVLDSFSKWLMLFAVPDSSAASVIKCLHKVFTTYGSPKNIVSDNATNFQSNKFKEFCASWGSKTIRTSPYHPSSNAVERVIRNVRSTLAILLEQQFDNHLNWDLLLDNIAFSNNTSFHESIKSIPCKVFLSREIKLPIDLKSNIEGLWENPDIPSVEAVKDMLMKAHDKYAKQYNKNRNLTSKFKIGDKVVQKIHHTKMRSQFHLKFLPRYSQPRVIVEFTSPVSVLLQDPATGEYFRSHVEHLKACS